MMIDFHSHIIPGVDDGSDSVENSLRMLEVLYNQGIETVVATPHFYGQNESVESFLKRRNSAFEQLYVTAKENMRNLPDILLGAEVALTPDISNLDGLEKLCIGNTNTILIELPYGDTSDWITYAVYEIIAKRRLKPVLAHFERFCREKNALERFSKLVSLDLFIQVNADSFIDKPFYKAVKKLIKNNQVSVIGSDMHNLKDRNSNYDKAVYKIKRKFGEEYLTSMQNNAKKLLELN